MGDSTTANTSWQDIRQRRIKTDRDERDVAAERWLLRYEVALDKLRRLRKR